MWACLPSFFSLFTHLVVSSPQHLSIIDDVLVREKDRLCPWSGKNKRPLPHHTWTHGDPISSHSSLLGSLGDAVNHCPDPPAVQALAGKQIASHCSEFSTSFSLQTSYGWTDSTLSGKGRARIQYSQEASGSHWGYDQDICHSLLPSKGLMNGGLTQPTWSPIAPWPRLLQPT